MGATPTGSATAVPAVERNTDVAFNARRTLLRILKSRVAHCSSNDLRVPCRRWPVGWRSIPQKPSPDELCTNPGGHP